MLKRIPLLALLLMMGICLWGVYQEVKADNAGSSFDQTIPGKWSMKLQVDPEAEKNYRFTKAENDCCRGKMGQLIEILKNNPTLKSLKGFNILGTTRYLPPDDWYGQHQPPYKNLRVRMEFRAYLPELFRSGGKIMQVPEAPYLDISFNEPNSFRQGWELQYNGLWDEQGRDIFLEPHSERKIGEIAVYGHAVIIAKRNRPLWVPVTQEQFLKAQYWHYRQQEKKGGGDLTMMLNLINEHLSALSPEERRQTAYYSSGAEDPLGLSSPDDQNAIKLVMVNPDYYDRSLPRTAVQLIVINYGYGMGFTSYEEADWMVFEKAGSNKTLYDLEQTLDYQAVTKLLD